MSRAKRRCGTTGPDVRRPGIVFRAATLILAVGTGNALAQPVGEPSAVRSENAQARTWFEDARFGLFIHWGVYSLVGKGEWVMDHDKIPISEYAKLPPPSIRLDSTPWPGPGWPDRLERDTSRSPPSITMAFACSPAG